MLKKTIRYNDLDGNPVTEDFYFNLTKAEIVELELSRSGGLAEYMVSVIADGDGSKIIATFKDILRLSYGVRSNDGKRFIKDEESWNKFTQTDAYSVLFIELVTDAKASTEFINGVLPADLIANVDAAMLGQSSSHNVIPPTPPSPIDKHPKDMSREELIAAYVARASKKTSD